MNRPWSHCTQWHPPRGCARLINRHGYTRTTNRHGYTRTTNRHGYARPDKLLSGLTERGRPVAGWRPVVVSAGNYSGLGRCGESREYPAERPRPGGGFLKRFTTSSDSAPNSKNQPTEEDGNR